MYMDRNSDWSDSCTSVKVLGRIVIYSPISVKQVIVDLMLKSPEQLQRQVRCSTQLLWLIYIVMVISGQVDRVGMWLVPDQLVDYYTMQNYSMQVN